MISYDDHPISTAIRAGDFEKFSDLVNSDPALATAKFDGDRANWTLLHKVASMGCRATPAHAQMVEVLISLGGNVNCRNGLGWTPIHLIAINGQKETVEVAKALIANGADLSATDNRGSDWRFFWQHGQEIHDLLMRHSGDLEPI